MIAPSPAAGDRNSDRTSRHPPEPDESPSGAYAKGEPPNRWRRGRDSEDTEGLLSLDPGLPMSILRRTPYGIVLITGSGTIVWANPAYFETNWSEPRLARDRLP